MINVARQMIVCAGLPAAIPTTTAAAKLTSAKQVAITFEGIVEHSFAHANSSPLIAFYMKRARCEVAELKKNHFVSEFACIRRSARFAP
jgi:hypothetical protein